MYNFVRFLFLSLILKNVNTFDFDQDLLSEVKSRVSKQCYEDLMKADKNLREFTIQAVSGWNAKTPGLISGTHDYTGNYEECLGSNSNSVVMQYCVVDVSITYGEEMPIACNKSGRVDLKSCSFSHVLKWGLCSVGSCSKADLRVLAEVMLQKSDIGLAGLPYKVSFEPGACQISTKTPFRTDAIVFLCLVGTIAAIVIICTVWHWSFNCKSADSNVKVPVLVRNWSLIDQFSSLMEISSDDIQILHSMKVLSMITIIIVHEVFFSPLGPVANLQTLFQSAGKLRYLRVDLAVDTFFAIAAFIFTKNFFTSRSKSFLEHILNRYFRIMPLYALMVFYATSMMEYTGRGPFWPYVVSLERDSCRQTWWLSLLFLGNYGSWKNHCWTMTWYLPCDFHFLMVGILVCHLIKKNEKLGIAAVVTLIVAALFSLHAFIVKNRIFILSPLLDDWNRGNHNWEDFMQIYIRSHFRIPSYLIGTLGGYIAYIWTKKQIVISQRTSINYFLLCVVIMTLVLVSELICVTEIPYSALNNGLFGTFVRPLWAMICMVFTIVFLFGYVPKFSEFFNMKFWYPLSKLSYSVYLVHMILVYRRIGSRVEPFVYGDPILIVHILVDTILIIALALVVHMFVEKPVYGMFKITLEAFRSSKETKRE